MMVELWGENMNIIEKYVEEFNKYDREIYFNGIKNKDVTAWMKEEIPVFSCPEKDIEKIYYFRWWTFRKHLKETKDGYMISEFLPDVPWAGRHNVINAPFGHHLAEGRWLKNAKTYLKDYIDLMLSDAEDVKSHQYSTWMSYAILEYCKVVGMPEQPEKLLEKMCEYHKIWEEKHGVENGMFWSLDLPDAMEFSVSGTGEDMKPKKGIRPTLNAYMCADRYAIAEFAELTGNAEVAETYRKKANELRDLINENLWADGFYRAFHYEGEESRQAFLQDGSKIAREQIGYIPWMFCIPPQGREKVFELLLDDKVFYAPQGLTTADQSHSRFLYDVDWECLWNGYVWPYATSQTLVALRNVIHYYEGGNNYKDMYYTLLKQYAASHTIEEDEKILPWIDEMKHPYKNEWTTRKWLEDRNYPPEKGPVERGKDYNHSTFCDLVISGIVGVNYEGEELTVSPIIPEDWNYFELSNLWFRGKCYTIRYDKTGEKYHEGTGIIIKEG